MTDQTTSALAWFPLYAGDWLSSPAVAMMLPEQEGAYIRLLVASWGKGDVEPSLPNDPAQLAQLSRLGARWKKLGALVLEQFERRDGRLVNARLAAIWWEQQQKHSAAVLKATNAANARHKKRTSTSPSTAPALLQADLELARRTQIEEGTAPDSTPNGVESQEHVPAPDRAPAPEGAALVGADGERVDYLEQPSVREALARRGIRAADLIKARPDVQALRDAEASQRERDTRHWDAVKGWARAWMREHPAETREIGRACRAHLDFPQDTPLTGLKADTLERCVIEEISRVNDWPAADAWDGETTFPLIPLGDPAHA